MLDPRHADVDFVYAEVPPGCGQIGRIYYWFDPAGQLPAVDDHDLRRHYPEIDDDEWRRLFREAYRRGVDPSLDPLDPRFGALNGLASLLPANPQLVPGQAPPTHQNRRENRMSSAVASIDLPADTMKAILDAMPSDSTPEERGLLLTTLGKTWAEAIFIEAVRRGRVRIERDEDGTWFFTDAAGTRLWVIGSLDPNLKGLDQA